MEVYIVFSDTKTILSTVVKMYSGHSYGHVSIAFDRHLNEMYSFGRKHMNNAFNGGFVREDVSNWLFQRAHIAIYKCELADGDYGSVRRYIEKIKQNEEEWTYNFTGLFGILINKDMPRKKAFFCSQFVAEAMAHGGVSVSGKPPGLVMPVDLFRLPELRFVYSGRLADYQEVECRTAPVEDKFAF